jgi:acetyl-CoA carboxylase biotin carboxylase subunit
MYEGWNVPIDYDPLLAKLIGYGTDRDQAISRLTRALSEYFVGGIKTNISLFRRILRDPDFRAAKLDTGFLDRMLKRAEDKTVDAKAAEVAAIAAGLFAEINASTAVSTAGLCNNAGGIGTGGNVASNWKSASRREALR